MGSFYCAEANWWSLVTSEEIRAFEIGRAIELAREAFVEAMRDEGIPTRTRFTISARAELKIRELLEFDAEDREAELAAPRAGAWLGGVRS